jgi:hypothetical protein
VETGKSAKRRIRLRQVKRLFWANAKEL